jgi:Rieske Fe-S protein
METATNLITNLLNRNGNVRSCEVCGNEYYRCLEVRLDGETHIFDCFECAIYALAPRCAHCGCQMIGHGMEANGVFYCCAHCARQEGVLNMEDHLETERSKV